MADRSTRVTFVVPANLLAADANAPETRGAERAMARSEPAPGASGTTRASAVIGEDVVELTIANGPTLVLSPENARDLMRAQGAASARGASAGDADGVVVDARLGWPGLDGAASRGATRGWLGQAVLTAFKIVTGIARDPAVSLVQSAVVRKIDGAVSEGVYPLTADPLPPALKGSAIAKLARVPASTGGPLLVLVHGTFVDTVSTFGKLWQMHPDKVGELVRAYQGRVYAFDHPTMSESPIANALALVRALPDGARLHLVTHSRGGLVAEVLARACGGGPVTADELELFADSRYARHRADVRALVKEAQARGIRVERVVRVACPARGTTLASGRLDAYLSVLRWGLELAHLPISAELVDFLHEVARRRADPRELPGIEAMMPESAVVQWLDRTDVSIPGDLRVVAGDLQGGGSIGGWVKTLLSDAFYWTDNDLVVQTRSMYGGVPRAAAAGAGPGQPSASFLLDRGSNVTHFNYFANQTTVDAITRALIGDAPAGFAAIGPLSWSGQSTLGLRGAAPVPSRRGAAAVATRPAVFVLPGILGSNLAIDGQRIWLGPHFVNGLARLAWDPATATHVLPDGPIEGSYGALVARLGETHEAIPFPFDWRRPIEDEALRLAAAVNAAMDARASSGQPVRLLAHSMGGLVARTMQLVAPATWSRMMAGAGARVLMLGVPNAGSWSPMQILSGDDTFGNALVAFGALTRNGEVRAMIAGMPGLMQLQAGLTDPATNLEQQGEWDKLVAADKAALQTRLIWHDPGDRKAIYDWSAPPQAVLTQAANLRRRLDAQLETLRADHDKMLLVVGRSSFTPTGISMGEDGLDYLGSSDSGDGRVTYDSAMQLGVMTWKIDAEHGDLPATAAAFAGYVDLLTTGTTTLLQPYAPASRGGRPTSTAPVLRSRPSRGLLPSEPPSFDSDVFGAATGERAPETSPDALEVAVLNADLRFVDQALLIGHYTAVRLTGAEAAIDRLIASGMSRGLAAGLYPDAVGTHQIFGNARLDPENPTAMARPAAAVVCGLGPEGKLSTVDLAFSIKRAVLAYAQRLADREGGAPEEFDLCATLIGSGGTGINVGSSALALVQGAFDAKQKMAASRWPKLRRLTLVELYLDRAADAWRALQMQQSALPDRLRLVGRVGFGPGAMRRTPDTSYRGANYDFIRAFTAVTKDAANPVIAYTLDTKRARTEIRAQRTQGRLLREMVKRASNDANGDPLIGRTLFNLLIPVEMEPFLAGTTSVVLELERATAGIPWELLDTDPSHDGADRRPWAIRNKLIRKLEVRDTRVEVRDASADDKILVVGEPMCDPTRYPRLPGARSEAVSVAGLLRASMPRQPDDPVRDLVDQADAHSVINALFKCSYRAVHIAGHGMAGRDGGVVLSGNTYLGANEVQAMRVIPELVFLNCCHLASSDSAAVLKGGAPEPYDRADFAANMAESLIRVGVRCVIAAGWAVEDGPAETFARQFYSSLLGGKRFADAVGDAREAAWNDNPSGVTWAAYQCYGDPDWAWSRETGDAQRPQLSAADEPSNVASPVSLALALESIAIESQYAAADNRARLVAKLSMLETEFGPVWGGSGAVAEAFGLAHASMGAADDAIAWYAKALDAEDGSASFKAAEQLGNLLVRQGKATNDVVLIRRGIDHLQRLATLRTTSERESLLGSAWKRLAMAETGPQAALAALDESILHYRAAADMSRAAGSLKRFYPTKNCISAEMRRAFMTGVAPRIGDERIADLSEALNQASMHEPDFWSVAGQSELGILQALLRGRLADEVVHAVPRLRELKVRVPAVWMWDSVRAEAEFVLRPYIGRAGAGKAEKDAAGLLLEMLKEFAAVAPAKS